MEQQSIVDAQEARARALEIKRSALSRRKLQRIVRSIVLQSIILSVVCALALLILGATGRLENGMGHSGIPDTLAIILALLLLGLHDDEDDIRTVSLCNDAMQTLGWIFESGMLEPPLAQYLIKRVDSRLAALHAEQRKRRFMSTLIGALSSHLLWRADRRGASDEDESRGSDQPQATNVSPIRSNRSITARMRETERIVPTYRSTTVEFNTGRKVPTQIIDLSPTGVALETASLGDVGAIALVGQRPARVVRHFVNGTAFEFLSRIPDDEFSPEIRL